MRVCQLTAYEFAIARPHLKARVSVHALIAR
eukprot:SAG11_NODE_6887_length_1231_cov_1.163428_3_plen_30_part_01